jgi:hypothetical protein
LTYEQSEQEEKPAGGRRARKVKDSGQRSLFGADGDNGETERSSAGGRRRAHAAG